MRKIPLDKIECVYVSSDGEFCHEAAKFQVLDKQDTVVMGYFCKRHTNIVMGISEEK